MIKKVFRNTIFLSLSQIISRGIGFIYFIFLARSLGVADFGIYSFTIAFIYNFIPVADFGIERLILRDISRDPEKIYFFFQRLVPLRIILSFLAYFIAIGLGIALGISGQRLLYLAIFGLALFPYNFAFLIISFQNAREKMQYLALANILIIFITATLGTIFVLLKMSFFWIFLAYPFSNLMVAIYMFIIIRKWNFSLRMVIDFEFCQKILSNSWIFAAFTIIAVFYLRTTVLFVGIYKDSVSSGLYNSVFKFIEAGILIPQSLALALFPLSSRLFQTDKKKLFKIYLRSLGLLFLFSLPFALLLIVFPDFIILSAYGKNFLPAAGVFRVLGLSLILFFVNTLPGNIIQNSENVKKFLPFSLISLFFVIVLSSVLIPKYSLVGAGWSVFGGELIGFLISNYFVYKFLHE